VDFLHFVVKYIMTPCEALVDLMLYAGC